MEFLITLIRDASVYLHMQSLLGRLAWLFSIVLIFWVLWNFRAYQPRWKVRDWGLLLVFILAAVAGSVFLGLAVPLRDSLPLKGQIGRQDHIAWMLFSHFPSLLAAGFLGPLGGALVGGVSGLAYSFLQTHSPFTILEFSFLGVLAGFMFHQVYQTRFFRLVASPLVTSILLALIYPVLFFFGVLLGLDDPASSRLDYAFRLLLPSWVAVGGSLVFSGVLVEPISRTAKQYWGHSGPLSPSPAERSIETRSFILMGLVVAGLAILLSVIGWFVAYQSALRLVEDRVSGTAKLAAESIPTTLEIGQNLILSTGQDSKLGDVDTPVVLQALEQAQSVSVFFNQLLISGINDELIATFVDGVSSGGLTQVENAGVELARAGVPFQYYTTVQPEPNSRTILSFITPVPGSDRVLIGRSYLDENPFASPLLESLADLEGLEGDGILLGDNAEILYHPVRSMIGTNYASAIEPEGQFSNVVAADGSQVFAYSIPVPGRSWRIVIEVPVLVVQEQALRIAGPLVGLLLALALVSMLLLRLILRIVTGSLRALSVEANRIAENTSFLDSPLDSAGVDEVGVMRKAFERMRVSLKARMDEQRQLLIASHGAASSLDFTTAVKPLLGAALSTGASSARIVLTGGALSEAGIGDARTFGAGPMSNLFSYLDSQLLHLSKEKNPLVIQNPVAEPNLKFIDGRPIPSSILSIPLIQENVYFGALWVAYENQRKISEDEVRFLSTLAAQGALAAANARLFMGAEIGRERLAAILASTPDPVIVTDQNGNLLLANPAACHAFGEELSRSAGTQISELLNDEKLIEMFATGREETFSSEIVTKDGRVYLAKATSVMLKNREVGTVCVMRDVTHFKKLDEMKSEFVSHVSHDLKSPLLIMRGYATMVPLIGDLSEEQMSYIHKITHGVDRMARLVGDLLHLGRFETGFDLELEMLSPIELIASVIDNLQPLAQKKKISMTAETDTVTGVQIEADRLFVDRALNNLVENAIKYTGENGRISITTQLVDNGSAIRFIVKDNGIGIDPVDQERLFEKFYRARDREARKQLGSGLGLAIVKSIVERHHGSVGFESIPGKGSRFHMTLPLRQPVS